MALLLWAGLPRCKRIPKALAVTVTRQQRDVEHSRHPDDLHRVECGCGLWFAEGRRDHHQRHDCLLTRVAS